MNNQIIASAAAAGGAVECATKVAEGSSEVLPPQSTSATSKLWLIWICLIDKTVLRLWRFLVQAWDIGCKEPRKCIHGLKVGIALSVVSLFYYTRPLYDGVGGTAMWAVLTVVVVFEYTVGKAPEIILTGLEKVRLGLIVCAFQVQQFQKA